MAAKIGDVVPARPKRSTKPAEPKTRREEEELAAERRAEQTAILSHAAEKAARAHTKRERTRRVTAPALQETSSTALVTRAPTVEGEMRSALTQRAPKRRADQHPAAIYLARLAAGSRPTMKSSLETIAGYSNTTIELLPWHELRYQHTQALRAKLALSFAPNTANKMLCALRGVLKEAWRLGLMSTDDYMRASDLQPVRGSRIPKGRSLSELEIKKLFGSVDTSTLSGARDAALLAVMYGTGIRRNEVTGLTLDSFDEIDKSLRVRGKGNKERYVYMDDSIIQVLTNWLKMRGPGEPKEPLFIPIDKWGHVFKRRLNDKAVTFRLEDMAEKAKVKEFAAHDTRRTFVTTLLERDVDIATVQKLAGHASVTTTARYDRRDEAAKKEAVKVLKVPVSTP